MYDTHRKRRRTQRDSTHTTTAHIRREEERDNTYREKEKNNTCKKR